MKIHRTWEAMRPYGEGLKKESFEEYYSRMLANSALKHIPQAVYEQWIYEHHAHIDAKNYSWLDYSRITFTLHEWHYADFSRLYILEGNDSWEELAAHTEVEQLALNEEDLRHWQYHGTWRVPPVILDVQSLKSEIPEDCEIKGFYQLIEGHSRLGYVHAWKTISTLSNGPMSGTHKIYLMNEVI